MNGIGKETTLEYHTPLWRLLRTILGGVIAVILLAVLWYAFVQWRKAGMLRAKIAQEQREYSRNRRR